MAESVEKCEGARPEEEFPYLGFVRSGARVSLESCPEGEVCKKCSSLERARVGCVSVEKGDPVFRVKDWGELGERPRKGTLVRFRLVMSKETGKWHAYVLSGVSRLELRDK